MSRLRPVYLRDSRKALTDVATAEVGSSGDRAVRTGDGCPLLFADESNVSGRRG